MSTIHYASDNSGAQEDVTTMATTMSDFLGITGHWKLVIGANDALVDRTVKGFLVDIMREHSKPPKKSLLIIFYAGHGELDIKDITEPENRSRDQLWGGITYK